MRNVDLEITEVQAELIREALIRQRNLAVKQGFDSLANDLEVLLLYIERAKRDAKTKSNVKIVV